MLTINRADILPVNNLNIISDLISVRTVSQHIEMFEYI